MSPGKILIKYLNEIYMNMIVVIFLFKHIVMITIYFLKIYEYDRRYFPLQKYCHDHNIFSQNI